MRGLAKKKKKLEESRLLPMRYDRRLLSADIAVATAAVAAAAVYVL